MILVQKLRLVLEEEFAQLEWNRAESMQKRSANHSIIQECLTLLFQIS